MAVQLDELCTEKGAMALLVPKSEKIWKVGKSLAEAVRHESIVYSSEDVVVPVDQLPATLAEMSRICQQYNAASRTVSHAGDGNIHLMILKNEIPDAEWNTKLAEIQQDVFDYVYKVGGKLSGEHGIGYKKKALMEQYASKVELDVMRSSKQAMDPNHILNPGKIFDMV